MRAIIEPLVGVKFEKHELRFGMERYEIEEFLGISDDEEFDRDTGYVSVNYNSRSAGLSLDYENDLLVSVQFSSENYIKPELFGKDIFSTDCDEIIALLNEHDPGGIENDDDVEYTLRRLKLSFWREESPKDFKRYLSDMRANGRDPRRVKHREEVEQARLGSTRFALFTCAAKNFKIF